MPTNEEEVDELSAEGSAKTKGAFGMRCLIENGNTLSVLTDPSADGSPFSSKRAGTSKASLFNNSSTARDRRINERVTHLFTILLGTHLTPT